MTDKRLEKYCDLMIKRGVNLQKNQILAITSSVENADVIRIITEKAFAAGAKDVVVQWQDEQTDKTRYLNAGIERFRQFEPWKKLEADALVKEKAAFLFVTSSTPGIYKDVQPNKLVDYSKARQEALKLYIKAQSNGDLQWCICAVASEGWAAKVFPNEKNSENAVKKLWDAIYACSRVDDNNVFDNWKKHDDNLKKRVTALNKHDFKSLIYTNSLGTNLVLGLPEGHIWRCATSSMTTSKIKYTANIPTEEIYSGPDRNRVDGVVYGSMPFMYLGNLIEDFAVWFKDGKAVKVTAKKNQKLLEKLITSFKNSDRLGEVALVPHNSPISKAGILFYNTLYDENASCHLAFGRASPHYVKNAAGKSEAQLAKMGINISDTHNDFMIGTKDLSIVGVKKNGKKIDVFVNGNFV